MERPRVVEGWLRTWAVLSVIVAGAASIWFRSFEPLGLWLLLAAGLVAACAMVTLLYAITLWPFLLLIARFSGRTSNGGRAAGDGVVE